MKIFSFSAFKQLFKMHNKKQLPPALLRQKYQHIKAQVTDTKLYPAISTIINIQSFVKENQALYHKLLTQLKEVRSTNIIKKSDKANIKIKTTPFYLNNSIRSVQTSQDDKLKDAIAKNQILRKSIGILKQQNIKKIARDAPILKEKQQLIKDKTENIQKLKQLGKQLNRALANDDVLELYEVKCRQCESLRNVNNQISEQIKTIILQINQLTGSEQNPNMFLMNLKV